MLEANGYVSKTVADILKANDYPATQDGYKAYMHAAMVKNHASMRAMVVAENNPEKLANFDAQWDRYFSKSK